MPTTRHAKTIQSAILDCLSYYAVFGLRLNSKQLFELIHCKATVVAVESALTSLRRKKVVAGYKDGSFGIAGHHYPKQGAHSIQQAKLLSKAKRLSKALQFIPWIKSVVVINSVAYGNCTDKSDIDLLFVTTPHRLYITKGIVYHLLNILRLRETSTQKAGRFSTGWWLTTNGVKFERDLMPTADLQLPYWCIMAKPVYGDRIWEQLLASSQFLRDQFPNYSFKHHGLPIHLFHMGWLDRLDSRGFRMHLRHVALQEKYKQPNSFLRVRPDLIVQNSDAKAQLKKISNKYLAIHEKVSKQ